MNTFEYKFSNNRLKVVKKPKQFALTFQKVKAIVPSKVIPKLMLTLQIFLSPTRGRVHLSKPLLSGCQSVSTPPSKHHARRHRS